MMYSLLSCTKALKGHGDFQLDNPFSRIEMCNLRERLATRENGLSNSRERIAIRENELSNSRERITNSWERINNPWERIAQFDITIYLGLFLKISMSFQGIRIHECGPTILNQVNVSKAPKCIRPKLSWKKKNFKDKKIWHLFYLKARRTCNNLRLWSRKFFK